MPDDHPIVKLQEPWLRGCTIWDACHRYPKDECTSDCKELDDPDTPPIVEQGKSTCDHCGATRQGDEKSCRFCGDMVWVKPRPIVERVRIECTGCGGLIDKHMAIMVMGKPYCAECKPSEHPTVERPNFLWGDPMEKAMSEDGYIKLYIPGLNWIKDYIEQTEATAAKAPMFERDPLDDEIR